MSTKPMAGIRVVEIAGWLTAPFAGAILADQGADVIKIEPPEGDTYRFNGTTSGGFGAQWVAVNRNKRSLCLDLKKESHKKIVHALIAKADVALQNLRPGAIEKLGFGAKTLCQANPRLIYASVCGYGPTGPHAGEGAFDTMLQAMGGVAAVQADDSGRPQVVRTILPDKLTGVTLAQAIAAALFERERTGKGAVLDLAMLDAVVWWMWPDGMANQTFLGPDVKIGGQVADVDLMCPTLDGYIIPTAHLQRDWEKLAKFIDRPDWLTDPRLSTARARGVNLRLYASEMRKSFHSKTTAEWCAILKQLDIPYAPVLSREEVVSYPQVVANGILSEYDHPQAGRYRAANGAVTFDGERARVEKPAPALGAHNREILEEYGLDPTLLD